jgi:hypothetical protein
VIVDCLLYAGEADMLELRLRTLDHCVDRFVVVEGDRSHSGEERVWSRPDLNKRFEPWARKLQPLLCELPPLFTHDDLEVCGCNHIWSEHSASGCWHTEDEHVCACTAPREFHRSKLGTPYYQVRERVHRDSIKRLQHVSLPDDTIVFVSDCDEIWSPDALDSVRDALTEAKWVVAQQSMRGFCVDWHHPQCWLGSMACHLDALEPQNMRDARGRSDVIEIPNAGWHFSWFGTPQERQRKLTTFSHGELVNNIDPDDCYKTGRHSNGEELQPIEMADCDWPTPMLTGEFHIPPSWRRPR